MRRFFLNMNNLAIGFAAIIGLSLVFLGGGYSHSWAAPSISSIQGTVSDGNSITITGTGFGSTGPTIVMFDDFELGPNGGFVSDQVRSAQVGTWRAIDGMDPYFPTYSNLAAHSGSKSLRQNWSSGSGQQEGARWAAPTISNAQTKIYFSFWVYLPVGQNVPGACCGLGPNWKVWWLSSNDIFADDFASEIVTNPPSETSICWVDGSQSRVCYGYNAFNFTKGRWKRFEVYMVGSTSSGSASLWFTDSGEARNRWGYATGRTLDNGSPGWRYLHFPGYGRWDSNSNTYYDDIYVAAGEGAQARVELGNNASYSSCTNLAVITPTSWGDNQIVATVRKGSFSEGQQGYLFVIDATGAVNSQGFRITFSGSSQDQAPSPPSGLVIKE